MTKLPSSPPNVKSAEAAYRAHVHNRVVDQLYHQLLWAEPSVRLEVLRRALSDVVVMAQQQGDDASAATIGLGKAAVVLVSTRGKGGGHE